MRRFAAFFAEQYLLVNQIEQGFGIVERRFLTQIIFQSNGGAGAPATFLVCEDAAQCLMEGPRLGAGRVTHRSAHQAPIAAPLCPGRALAVYAMPRGCR